MTRLDDVRARHAARLRTRAAKGDGETQMSTLVDDDMAVLLREVENLTLAGRLAMERADRAEAALEAAGGPSTEYVDWINERAEKAERLLVKSDYLVNDARAEVARRDKVLEGVGALSSDVLSHAGALLHASYLEDAEELASALRRGSKRAIFLRDRLRAALDTSEAPVAPDAEPGGARC